MAFSSDSVQLLLAVLDHGSFSAAARALGRVPSAVSMAMANLEAELDMELFERTGREPRPSAEQHHVQLGLQLRHGHADGRRYPPQRPRRRRTGAVVQHRQKQLHAVGRKSHMQPFRKTEVI